jgi:SAM-dependent methyltransferase
MRETALGAFDFIDGSAGSLRVEGWMALPGRRLSSCRIEVDGAALGVVAARPRPEIRGQYPWHDQDAPAGFAFTVPWEREARYGWRVVRVIGVEDRAEVMDLETLFVPDFSAGLPVPPAPLRRKVIGNDGANHYMVSGLKAVSDFFTAYRRHRDVNALRAVLDWGCGCGRVSQLIGKYHKNVALYGFDIDAEAVAWCQANLPGRFTVVPPDPPIPHARPLFDAVLGYSVMSHLDRARQRSWLAELARVTAPGGLVLLSVHGAFAARTCNLDPATRASIEQDLASDGISDRVFDAALDGVAPAAYYRGVFQTEAYTRATWSRELRVIEYIERGMGGFQDLVVLERVR